MQKLLSYIEFFIQLIRLSPNYLKAIIGRYITKKSFELNLFDGTKFLIDPKNQADISMMIEVFGMQFYNPPLFEISANDIVVDIGTHVGYFSLYASSQAKNGKIYSFEPLPVTFSHLQNHIDLNNRTNIVAKNIAIGGNSGEVDFYLFEGHNGCHSLYTRQKDQEKVRVTKKTLPEIMTEEGIDHIDFLKLDCEGAEFEILLNLPKDYFSKISKISMEIHNDIVEGMTEKNIIDCLRGNGFITSQRDGYIYALNLQYKRELPSN